MKYLHFSSPWVENDLFTPAEGLRAYTAERAGFTVFRRRFKPMGWRWWVGLAYTWLVWEADDCVVRCTWQYDPQRGFQYLVHWTDIYRAGV